MLGLVHAILNQFIGSIECLDWILYKSLIEASVVVQICPVVGKRKQNVADKVFRSALDEKKVQTEEEEYVGIDALQCFTLKQKWVDK